MSPAVETTSDVLRILLVDDDPLARRALREALSRYTLFEITGEAIGGAEAVSAAVSDRPDLVLMDIDMPDVDGVTATLRILREAPETHVVMLATDPQADIALLGLRAGAEGFLPKDVDPDALARALIGVAVHHEAAISRSLTLKLIERLRRLPDQAGGMRPVQSNLTSREWQVLDLMMADATTEEIATELVLATETVRSHIKHILAKLGAHSRAEAVEIGMDLRYTDVSLLPGGQGGEMIETAFRRVLERMQRGELREAREAPTTREPRESNG